jgi:hypothetical protein
MCLWGQPMTQVDRIGSGSCAMVGFGTGGELVNK